jgi:Phosphotransferase enzyme family
VVATRATLADAIGTGAAAVVVEGSHASILRENRLDWIVYETSQGRLAPSQGRLGRRGLVTVAASSRPVPFLVAALDERYRWWELRVAAAGGSGRSAFVLGETPSTPAAILKFARERGRSDSVDQEIAGLRVAAAGGPTVIRHASTIIDSVEVDGFAGVLESFAPGRPLGTLLAARTSRRSRFAPVRRVAEWLVDVGRETAAPADALAPTRAWLREGAVALAGQHGAPPDLVDRLPPVPAVLQHNDLWTGNVLVRDDGFTAVDWQVARAHGLPLFDLLYFLADALARLDRVARLDDRVDHFVSLFRGESRSSAVLFEWVNRAASAANVPTEAIGPLATLCRLEKGFAPWRPEEARAPTELKGRMAVAWLRDPQLGVNWRPPV